MESKKLRKLTQEDWRLAQASLKFFCVKFLGFHWPDFYEDAYQHLLNHDRLLFQCARGHGKSNLFSLGYPLWNVIRGNWEGVLVSYSEDQAKRLISEIRSTVMSNPLLEPIRPTTAEDWSTDRLSFPTKARIKAIGFGTSARGVHPDWIGVDDPLKDMGGLSIEDQERAYFGVICGMAMPHTKISVVGTPVDFGDLLTKIEEPERGYKCARYPAINPDGTLLFPEKWDKETLERRRAEMGSIHFAREFLLERVDPATQVFKNQFETLYEEVPTNFAHVITVIDPAYTENDGDATAIVTVGLTHGNHAYVLEAKEVRREDPGKVVDEIVATLQAQKPTAVGIEKRKGDAIRYSFDERRTRLNLWDFRFVELSHGSQSKSTRITSVGGIVPRWEARSIHIHKNQKNLLRQLYEYRADNSHSHDDLVDALAYCFHPDLARPNAGRISVPEAEIPSYGKAFYHVGHASGEPLINPILGRVA